MGADATMTIDLNGHSISRVHSNNKEGGHVIEVRNNGNLTLTSTANAFLFDTRHSNEKMPVGLVLFSTSSRKSFPGVMP